MRAFLRQAVGKWYASMTAVFREGKIFMWEATFLWTMQGFRAAVLSEHAMRWYNRSITSSHPDVPPHNPLPPGGVTVTQRAAPVPPLA